MILSILEPLAVSAIYVPDATDRDLDRQLEAMWLVNCMASKVLAGECPVDDLLAAVESVGIDPDVYDAVASDRLNAAIDGDYFRYLDPGEVAAYGHN
jgi:hypothetical protein